MNPASDNETPPPVGESGMNHAGDAAPPSNWREALIGLVTSRIALIELESKEAASAGARRAASVVAAVIFAFFAWALLLAGGIAALSASTGWAWYWLALGGAAIHLLGAVIFMKSAKAPAQPSFPITRSEFQKDREWIENFQKTPKSNV